MRYLLTVSVLICLCSVTSYGREKASGWCEDGNYTVAVSGINSTTRVQRSFPSCTVTVYLGGTTTLASIFADNAGTVKANPFTAATSGQWSFFADNGMYDIRFSGGGITAPFTLFNNQIGPTTVDCSAFSGTSGGARIASCISSLPSTGGVADATNITGPQTISQNIFQGVTKPVTLLLGAATYTISAAQVLSANNSRIACRSTNMVRSGAITLWTISGADDTLEDCVIDGGGGAFTGDIIALLGSTRALIRNNSIRGLGGTGSSVSNGISASNTSDSKLVSNSIFGATSSGHGIFLNGQNGPVSGITIEGNRIDIPSTANSNAKSIEVASQTGGSNISNVTVTANVLSTGVNFCFEAGPFNGNPALSTVSDVTVTGNTCTATANSNGGFSAGSSGTQNIIFANNTYDAAGFTQAIGAFEIAGVRGFAVTGNTVWNASGVAAPISVSMTADDGTITGNTLTGFRLVAIDLGVSTANDVIRKITVSNNVIEFTAGVTGTGVWVQCNNASATCRNITVTGNTIFGVGTNPSIGINLEKDSGVMENITVSGNSIYTTNVGIQLAGVNGLSVTGNTYDAANTAASTGIYGINSVTNFNIGHNIITSLSAGVPVYTLSFGILLVGPNIDGVVSDNQITSVSLTANNQSGIRLDNTSATTTQRLTFSGNTINGHGPGYAVFINCGGGGGCQDILTTGNNLIGDGTAGSAGIVFPVSGTAQRLIFSNNTMQNFNSCVYGGNMVVRILNNTFNNCGVNLNSLGANVQVVDFSGTALGGVPALANGSMIYVTDATIANPCAGGGTGAILKRLNGVNVCN